jgi:hypothetical protein
MVSYYKIKHKELHKEKIFLKKTYIKNEKEFIKKDPLQKKNKALNKLEKEYELVKQKYNNELREYQFAMMKNKTQIQFSLEQEENLRLKQLLK